jgi:AcrR family transcriptional regulator
MWRKLHHTLPYVRQRIDPVNTLAYGPSMRHSGTLTPEDWIAAGFRALTEGGPQAVRIEAIARELKVSKGSFYWHFKDLPAFKSAMLRHWAEIATANVIAEVNEASPDPREQLRCLVKIAAGSRSDPYGGKLAEAAIRDWARYDADAAATLKAADLQRLEFLKSLLAACGTPPERAGAFASILYGALIGLEQLHHHGLADVNGDLAVLLDLLLSSGAELNP